MVIISSEISLNDLMKLLKREVQEITLDDLYELSYHFNEENKYLPEKYRQNYTDSFLNVMIKRFTLLKNDKKNYEGVLVNKDVEIVNKLLEKEENIITNILDIIIIYTTYFLKEPIHPPETPFPGSLSIYKDGKDYYCPVKRYHLNDEKSICKICIAKVTEE